MNTSELVVHILFNFMTFTILGPKLRFVKSQPDQASSSSWTMTDLPETALLVVIFLSLSFSKL